MGVTPTNLIQGPATLYRGAFGAAEPADAAINTTPQASAWTDMGGTQGGVTLTVAREYATLTVDQLVDTPERRMTSRDSSIKTNLAEATLDNLAVSLNESAPTTGAGFKYFELTETTAATQATYIALLFDGFAPSSFRRRVIGRRMLSIAEVGVGYTKDNQTVYPVEWHAHYVSSAIRTVKITDQTS